MNARWRSATLLAALDSGDLAPADPEFFEGLTEQDPEAAYRFVDAVEASLSLLSEMPEAGPRYETENAALAGRVRKWVSWPHSGDSNRFFGGWR